MKLVDEIAKKLLDNVNQGAVIQSWEWIVENDHELAEVLRKDAQAAIDVVGQRLLSDVSIAAAVKAVDRTDNLEYGIRFAWQAVKDGNDV